MRTPLRRGSPFLGKENPAGAGCQILKAFLQPYRAEGAMTIFVRIRGKAQVLRRPPWVGQSFDKYPQSPIVGKRLRVGVAENGLKWVK